MKIQEFFVGGSGWWGGGSGWLGGGGGQGGCERRIEVFVKIKNKKLRGGGSGCWGGQGGCERSIEVFVKIEKKNIYIYIYFFLGGVRGGEGGRVVGGGVRGMWTKN